jgi:uncharacterized membrane protein
MPADDPGPEPRRIAKGRFEAFSDGVFAIAITLLVLELAIDSSGSALDRVLEAWPSYLAYLVSFLTIGAAWLAHAAMSHRLQYVDGILMRLNLLLLLSVSLLPFPTRLVAEGIHELSEERVFVPMYGLTLLAIRLLLFAVDEYSYKEGLYEPGNGGEDAVRRTILPVLLAYVVSIIVGLVVPVLAVVFYCLLAIYLVIPFGELRRVFLRS